jgi:hypothetical protein
MMDASPRPPVNNTSNDSLNFSEMVARIHSYYKELKKQKLILLICIVLSLIYGIVQRYNHKKVYEAEVSFMINEEQNSISGFGSAIGQMSGLLGINSDVNLQKILELSKSRRIAEKVFSFKCNIGGTEDFLANHFIAELESNNQWISTPFYNNNHPLKNFRFKRFITDSFEPLENKALQQAHAAFINSLETDVSEKTAIMKLKLQSTGEQLCYLLSNRLFQEMSNFYIDKMVEKQRETFGDLKYKTDSLKTLIDSKVYKLAGIKDSYRSTWLYQEDVPKTLLDQEIRMLSVVYTEALKNREMASFALENRTPFIQAIDLPILPLKGIQKSWMNVFLLSLLYGAFAGCIIILLRKLWREEILPA